MKAYLAAYVTAQPVVECRIELMYAIADTAHALRAAREQPNNTIIRVAALAIEAWCVEQAQAVFPERPIASYADVVEAYHATLS